MSLERLDAEEFSQSLEQIGEGWFRQLALGIKLGAPEALGLTRRQWSDRIGLKVRDRAERINIEIELSAEGLSNRAIADVLGVDESTVRADKTAGNPAPPCAGQGGQADDAAGNPAPYYSPMPKFTGDFEWYTPQEYIELAREVLGGIDCDPASCADANKVVGAEVFYSQDDDGLKQKWRGRVWLNPPYATELIRPFVSLLLEKYANGEVTEAIALTNNVTETLAIQTLMRSCHAICFPEGRIKFYKTTEPERENGAGHGQALFYFGKNASKFRHVFGRKGQIVLPWREDALALFGQGAAGGAP